MLCRKLHFFLESKRQSNSTDFEWLSHRDVKNYPVNRIIAIYIPIAAKIHWSPVIFHQLDEWNDSTNKKSRNGKRKTRNDFIRRENNRIIHRLVLQHLLSAFPNVCSCLPHSQSELSQSLQDVGIKYGYEFIWLSNLAVDVNNNCRSKTQTRVIRSDPPPCTHSSRSDIVSPSGAASNSGMIR